MQLDFNPAKIKLIIGLGNPEQGYKNTYHNAGYLFIDHIEKHNRKLANRSLKTDTYMNSSGGFVKGITKKKGIGPNSLLIAHDDSDLDLGTYKINFGSGSAGHKGVDSIIKSLGTKDFWRLRIGIRPTGIINRLRGRKKAGDLVLKKISPKNGKILEQVFDEISSCFEIRI